MSAMTLGEPTNQWSEFWKDTILHITLMVSMAYKYKCIFFWGAALSWSYGSRIYNYLCNQCLSSLKLWVRTPLRWNVLDTTLCDKVCQFLVAGRWFSTGTPVSSTSKTDHHDITEILLKVVLNTITTKIQDGWHCSAKL